MKKKFSKIRIIGVVLFLQIIHSTLYSQEYLWANTSGSNTSDMGKSIATDAYGNVFTIGSFGGTVDFDPGPSVFNLTSPTSTMSSFISKKDDKGNFLWAKSIIGANFNCITIDLQNNVHIAGSFSGNIDFDLGPTVYNLRSSNEDMFISKIDNSGNFIWALKIGSTGNETIQSICLDANGNIFTTGFFSGTTDLNPSDGEIIYNSKGGNDIFISKFNSTGSVIWGRAFGSINDDKGVSIAIDNLGNVFTTGSIGGVTDFDPLTVNGNVGPVQGNSDIYISKHDANGLYKWAKNISGPSNESGVSIQVDINNNIITAGNFLGTTDFDPNVGTYNMTSLGATDIYVCKLNTNADLLWAKQFGGSFPDEVYNIATDKLGNIYTCGFFGGSVDFDPNISTTFLVQGNTNYEGFIHKLDSDGNFDFVKPLLTSSQNNIPAKIICSSICLSENNYILCTGSYTGNVDFDPGKSTKFLVSSENWDIFNFASCNYTLKITSNSPICVGQTLSFNVNTIPSSTYSWTGPNNFNAAIQNPSVLNVTNGASGEYKLTSNNGCIVSETFNVTLNQPPTISPSSNSPVCESKTLDLFSNSSQTVKSYLWTGPNNFSSSNSSSSIKKISLLGSGEYTVLATGTNGCQISKKINVIVNAIPTINITSLTNVSVCSYNNNGFISTSVNGGLPPYTFYWSTTPLQTTSNATNLTEGQYRLNVKDANGCMKDTLITVSAPSPIFNFIELTDVTCYGGINGSAVCNSEGGNPPYSYSWNTLPSQSGSKAINLSANNYILTVTDSKGCKFNESFAISSPSEPIKASLLVTNNSKCSGVCNGQIIVSNIKGGYTPYSFQWGESSNFQTSYIAKNLCAGNHQVVVTDSLGCTYKADTIVSNNISNVFNSNVYLTNLAAIDRTNISPSFSSYYSYDLPPNISSHPSNPRNFVDPGKKARFKIECTNQKSNGQSIVSGICKVRSNSSFINITDSSSALNNIAWNGKAWSADEFEIDINPNTPPGTNAYIDFVVQENGLDYKTTCIPIPITPLVYSPVNSSTIDDDNNPDSKGDNDDSCEPGEIIEFYPWLDNVSKLNAEYVRGKFENLDNHNFIKIWNGVPGINTTVYDATWWNYSSGKPQVINSGSVNTTPEYDFVFDYTNLNVVNNFKLYLVMAGGFKLFNKNALSLVQWSLPYTFNKKEGVTEIPGLNLNSFKFNLFPNPSSGNLSIETEFDVQNEVSVYNVTGQCVDKFNFNNSMLKDLSQLPNGIYTVELKNVFGIYTSKLILNK